MSQPDENRAQADVRESGDTAQVLEDISTSVMLVVQSQYRTYCGEDRQKHEDDAGGAQKEDVKGGVLDDRLHYGRYPDGRWAAPQQADHYGNKYPHVCHKRQSCQSTVGAEWTAVLTKK